MHIRQTHPHMHTYAYTDVYTYTCTSIHARAHTRTHMHMHTNTFTYTHAQIHIHKCNFDFVFSFSCTGRPTACKSAVKACKLQMPAFHFGRGLLEGASVGNSSNLPQSNASKVGKVSAWYCSTTMDHARLSSSFEFKSRPMMAQCFSI